MKKLLVLALLSTAPAVKAEYYHYTIRNATRMPVAFQVVSGKGCHDYKDMINLQPGGIWTTDEGCTMVIRVPFNQGTNMAWAGDAMGGSVLGANYTYGDAKAYAYDTLDKGNLMGAYQMITPRWKDRHYVYLEFRFDEARRKLDLGVVGINWDTNIFDFFPLGLGENKNI
jgi:hypothetical protein